MDGLSRVWTVAENADAPIYFVHVSREGISAAKVRETATQLLAEVDRIQALERGDRTELAVLGPLAPMLRELTAVRDLLDDDPSRQAVIESKRELLALVDKAQVTDDAIRS